MKSITFGSAADFWQAACLSDLSFCGSVVRGNQLDVNLEPNTPTLFDKAKMLVIHAVVDVRMIAIEAGIADFYFGGESFVSSEGASAWTCRTL